MGSVHTQSKAHLQPPPPNSLPDSQGAPNLTIVGFCIHTQGPLDSTLLPLVRSSGHTFIHPPPLHSSSHAFLYSFTPVCTLSPSPRLFLPLPLLSLCSSPG